VSLHWSHTYIGRTYQEGAFDCADLARLVNREVFKREIRLPDGRDYAGKAGAAKLRAMTAQIEAERDAYVQATDSPVEGDCVLIDARGHTCHIGVYSVIAGEPWVLHAACDAMQVVLHRVRDMGRSGYRIEGYYRWI
jgi:hypothetical protein